MSDTDPVDDQYRKILTDYRGDLLKLRQESQTSYDKTLITISAGALAATVGFYEKLPQGTPIGFVLGAWIAWSLALILIVGSFSASGYSFDQTIDALDRFLGKYPLRGTFSPPTTKWGITCWWTSFISYWAFVAGVVLFAIAIFQGTNSPQQTNERQAKDRNRGAQSSTLAAETAACACAKGQDGKYIRRTSGPSTSPKAEEVTTPEIAKQPSSLETPHPPASASAEPSSE